MNCPCCASAVNAGEYMCKACGFDLTRNVLSYFTLGALADADRAMLNTDKCMMNKTLRCAHQLEMLLETLEQRGLVPNAQEREQLSGLSMRLSACCMSREKPIYDAKATNEEASELTRQAVIYMTGNGAIQSYEMAYKMLSKADKLGNAEASYWLGYMYDYGRYVFADAKKSMEYYEKAAARGNDTAMMRLGERFLYGFGVSKDEKKAFEWYKKAALNGNAEAMCRLGYAYRRGDGVKKDERESFDWFVKSAYAGNTDAMLEISRCYMEGIIVGGNMVKALEWRKKAQKGRS